MTTDEVMAMASSIMEDVCSRTLGTPEAVVDVYITLPAYLDRIEATIGFSPDRMPPALLSALRVITLDTGSGAQETDTLRGQDMAIQTAAMNWELVFDAWRHFTSDRSRATMYGACKEFCEKHGLNYDAFTAERMKRRDEQESRALRQDRHWIL